MVVVEVLTFTGVRCACIGLTITCTCPIFQNLAEAEYVVATFQYMRLLGYPAQSISILTTYNGQKLLIEDVISAVRVVCAMFSCALLVWFQCSVCAQKCASMPLFGRPRVVSTVDKYQGQQNDYVLLSLVRTKSVGHLRDVRRLVVAVRASH